jgi:hypothetical protein
MPVRRALAAAVAAALAAGAAVPAPARGEELPANSQALLLLRVLAYDRNLRQRAGQAVTVAVLYRPGDAASEERRVALVHAFEEVARDVVVAGLPVRVEALAWHDSASLAQRLAAVRPAVLYVDGALAPAVPEIVELSRRRGVLTAGAARPMVDAGLAIGIVPRGSRAGVIVNLPASRLEGAELEAGLLAVSEVVRE